MNRKTEKRIRKTDRKKRFYFSILAFVMLLFVPFFVYASEIKSDGKTTQAMEEENKTVRVGYFPYANFQEGGFGEHKQGAGYEYLQKISYITGWKYEYIYASFKECLDMLADGEIPLLIAEQVRTEENEKLRKDMDLHGLHVLLAEDNDLNAEIAIALLEEKGMIVTRAADGKAALTQFCNTASGTFDLILMDIMMPEMNGYETTKAIRNLPDRPDGKEIPIIAMTANAFTEDVQAVLNAGMDDHVAKPVDMSILISAITKYIGR